MPRKSWIAETAATVTGAVATPVKAVVKALAPTLPTRDPFYSDDARKRAITERGRRRWIERRPDWLRRWRA